MVDITRFTEELTTDAWERQKVVLDKTLFHGLFTLTIPVGKWIEVHDGVEQAAFTSATSVNGKLRLSSGAVTNGLKTLRSFRHPRYQPNKGALYATSIFLPNKNSLGIRRFGTFTDSAGVFFELEDGILYAVVRTHIDDVTVNDRRVIDTSRIDFSKGCTYDIQYQWRGVGNYTFFINQIPVLKIGYLGTRTELSIYNPALPVAFECQNTDGVEVLIECGCVEVASEGGSEPDGTYGSVGITNNTGQTAITGFNVPIIAIRSKSLIGTHINTRDTLALAATAYADQRALFRVWATRDFTAITANDQTWKPYGDGHLEYIEYDNPNVTTPMTFNTAKAENTFSCRVNMDSEYTTSALFENYAFIRLTAGDLLVFTMHRETGTACNAGVTFEFSEEI